MDHTQPSRGEKGRQVLDNMREERRNELAGASKGGAAGHNRILPQLPGPTTSSVPTCSPEQSVLKFTIPRKQLWTFQSVADQRRVPLHLTCEQVHTTCDSLSKATMPGLASTLLKRPYAWMMLGQCQVAIKIPLSFCLISPVACCPSSLIKKV